MDAQPILPRLCPVDRVAVLSLFLNCSHPYYFAPNWRLLERLGKELGISPSAVYLQLYKERAAYLSAYAEKRD